MIIIIKISFNMKTNFFMTLICTCFVAISSIFAQSGNDINFSFQIWRNSVNLGTYSGSTNNSNQLVTTSAMPYQICPGDELTIKQFCYKNGNQHTFTGTNGGKATISIASNDVHGAGITQIADVCQSGSCSTSPVHFPSWLWGNNNSITITVPVANYSTPFLAISSSIIGGHIHAYNCGIRTAFIPLNLAPSTSIADQTICPDDVVSIPTVSGFTYTNWSPNNPNITAPTTTTPYTVDITHATGCTQTESFTISVSNPEVHLSLVSSLCYNESTVITEEDIINLHQGTYGTTTPLSLTVNGVFTIFDPLANIYDYPHVIDATTYGTGIVTLEYTYIENGITCTKSYEIVIHPEIVLNMQSNYAFCSGNFQPIFATSGGIIGQSGITYIWTQSGVPFSVGTGPYFTPSSYGTYQVRAYDDFGCAVTHSFTVSDPGVGIQHPANITFCSMTQRSPSYIGWSSDPFGAIDYGFSWTYTNLNGDTYPMPNTGAQYQVSYWGPGTYTTVVTANGCTETISIVVTDLLQIHNNHPAADFSFTPLFGNQVSCQPSSVMLGVNNIWTVVDQNGVIISTIPYLDGIRFPYYTGVEYTVTLRREYPRGCQVYINQFTWLDDFGRNNRHENVSNNTTKLDAVNTTVSTFPNPTTGLVNIQLKDAETAETQIQVFNALGQVVLEKQVLNDHNIEVDLSKEISGIYILHIVNGTTQVTEKVIKQ